MSRFSGYHDFPEFPGRLGTTQGTTVFGLGTSAFDGGTFSLEEVASGIDPSTSGFDPGTCGFDPEKSPDVKVPFWVRELAP